MYQHLCFWRSIALRYLTLRRIFLLPLSLNKKTVLVCADAALTDNSTMWYSEGGFFRWFRWIGGRNGKNQTEPRKPRLLSARFRLVSAFVELESFNDKQDKPAYYRSPAIRAGLEPKRGRLSRGFPPGTQPYRYVVAFFDQFMFNTGAKRTLVEGTSQYSTKHCEEKTNVSI